MDCPACSESCTEHGGEAEVVKKRQGKAAREGRQSMWYRLTCALLATLSRGYGSPSVHGREMGWTARSARLRGAVREEDFP